MRVILLKTVNGMGKEGDTCEVADGHARNYLFPKHLAVPATDAAQDDVAARAVAERKAAERELARLQRLAKELDGLELVLHAKSNETGTLYGAIGVLEIIVALAEQGRALEEQWMVLEEPIKELGEYDVRCEMPHGLEATLRVIVEAEEQA